MSKVPILDLPLAIAIDGSETLAGVQAGTTKGILAGLLMQASASASTQTANTVFAGPATAPAAAPTFRALVAADFATATWSVTQGGTGLTSLTAYALLAGGTTSTGNVQQVSGVGTAGQALLSNGAAALPTWQTLSTAVGAALTRVDDTNVTLTLGGAPTTALLGATSLTLGWTGQLGLTRGGTAASLTASNGGIVYSTASAMAILSGTATAGQILRSGSSSAPSWSTSAYPATSAAGTILASLTSNTITATAAPVLGIPGTTMGTLALSGSGSGTVTLTPQATAGSPTLTFPNASGTIAVSATAPITLSATTGAIGVTGSALTRVDDTNVTLTLGGTPTTALLAATSLTLGWSGQLALTRGGTNASLTASNGGIFYSTASAGAILSGTATAGFPLLSGATAAPTWAAITYPASAASGGIPYFSTATAITSSAALGANQIVLGGGAGTTPATLGSLGTTTTVLHGNAAGAPTFGAVSLTADITGTLGVGNGGTATATTFTLGSVHFSTTSGVYAQDNANFFWDNTNKRLGIGTASPSYAVDASTTLTGDQFIRARSTFAGQNVGFQLENTLNRWRMVNGGAAGTFIFYDDSNSKSTFQIEVNTPTNTVYLRSTGAVGFGTASPLNTVDVNGSIGRNAPVTKTADFTLAATENWVINNRAATNTVTFPAASSWTGREVMLSTIQAQTVVSASSNVVPLAGGAAGTAILAATAGKWATLVSNGTNWQIMAGN